MTFTFGCARSLYQGNTHPRLLFGPDELAAMKRCVRSGHGKKIGAALRRWLHPLVGQILAAKSDEQALAVIDSGYFGNTTYWSLDEIAVLGRLDEDEQCVRAARRALLALPSLKHTGYGGMREVALAYDAIRDQLSESDRGCVTSWMVESGVRATLQKIRPGYFRNAGSNMRVCGMMSALFYLLVTQGGANVPDLSTERDELLLMLDATLHAAHGPDGYPIEDIGYGTALSGYLAYLVEAVRRAGLYDAYKQCPRFARFGRAILHFVQPWGEHLTSTGDQYDSFPERIFVLGRLARVTCDPSLAWLAGTISDPPTKLWPPELALRPGLRIPASYLSLLVLDDLKPVSPAKAGLPTQYVDRGRGLVSFRSGWNADDTFVVLDGSQRSPSAQGHHHSSCGHFDLSALGEYFAIDTGRYNMEQNCHNVVLVDGKSGRSSDGEWCMAWHHGLLTDYRPGDFVDFASVDSSHQHNCYWARRYLGLVKGKGAPAYVWMVDDINKANDWAEFWWQLHTSPENVIEIHDGRASIRGWRKGNFLDVHFALPDPNRYPKPHQLTIEQDEATPSSHKYVGNARERAKAFKRPSDMLHGAVFLRPRLLAKVAGYNGRFLSVMIPRRKGERPAKVQQLPSLDNSLALRITFAGVEDTLIWAYEHNLLEAGEVKARGNWTVVRRSLRTGKVMEQATG